MERQEVIKRLRQMLSIANELQGEGIELAGDIARIVAILKDKIRLLDPLHSESVN